jgi:hypothetical protein
MNTPQPPLTSRARLIFGLIFVALGSMPMLATFDIGPLTRADIMGPAWLGIASGGAFAAGGLAVIAGPRRPLLNAVLVLLVLASLAAIGNWIAFGVGARVCSGSVLLWAEGDLSGLGCRVPFGISAVIVNAMVVLFAVDALQKACGGPPRFARLRRLAEGLMLLSLAPILLPMALFLFGRVAFTVIRTRLTTGQWPRNEAFIKKQRDRAAKSASPE